MDAQDFKHAGGRDDFPRRRSEVETVRAAFAATEKREPVPPGRLHELTSAYESLDVKLDLRLTSDEKARWHEYAAEHNVSVSELVRDAVNERVG